MNCVQPIAPAEDGPMLQPWADSTSVSPASTVQRTPKALPARWKIGVSAAAPLHAAGERRPLTIFGLRPRLWLLRRASDMSAVTFAAARGRRRLRCQTALAGRPRLEGVWRQLRWRWLPRP